MKIRIKKFFKDFWRILKKPEMGILPGQLAFYFVLSIVPAISLISYLSSFLNISSEALISFISNSFSQDVANVLLSSEIVGGIASGAKFLMVLAVAFYISSNGSASIVVTSNAIYEIKNSGFIQRRIKSLVMTFMMLVLLIFILLIPVFGNSLITLISYIELKEEIALRVTWIIKALQGPLSWFIIFLILKLIYTMAPDRKVESSKVNYGAIFTTICWIIGTQLYSFYINNFAHYSAFYGALTNVVILMLWFYYLAFIFTVGMAFNYHKEEEENEKTEALKTIKGK